VFVYVVFFLKKTNCHRSCNHVQISTVRVSPSGGTRTTKVLKGMLAAKPDNMAVKAVTHANAFYG
jgi:hypothetical protein